MTEVQNVVATKTSEVEEGRTVLPFLSVVNKSIYNFTYIKCDGELVPVVNRKARKVGKAMYIHRISLGPGETLDSLLKFKTYLTTTEFMPHVKDMIEDGYQIFNVDSHFHSGFVPGGLRNGHKGYINSDLFQYKIVNIPGNGLCIQNSIPETNTKRYLVKGGNYDFYSKVDYTQNTTLEDLRLSRFEIGRYL